MVADAAHHGGQRVVLDELAPGGLVVAGLGVVEPLLDVLAGGAGVVARRQAVDVLRALLAPGPGLVGQARADLQRDREGLVHQRRSPVCAEQPEAADVAVCAGLDAGDDVGVRLGLEQMREALLRPEVVLDGYLAADLRDAAHLAVAGLEHGEYARLLREPRDPDRVLRRAPPAERTGDEDMQVARAADLHRRLHLRLEVPQLGDGGRRDVGDLVRHRDQRRALALAEHVPGLGADRLRCGRARRRWRGARALHARVHVRLVVVADVEHVVAPLEHPRQARHADVDGAAVATLAHDAHVLATLCPQRRGDARRNGGRVPEQRVDPGDPPRGLGVRRREDLEAARRVRGDHLTVGGTHGGVQRVARAERLPAALAGAVAACDRVRPLLAGLLGALLGIEQAIADREAARLVEADRGSLHARGLLIPDPPRPVRRHAGCSRRAGPMCARSRCARARGSQRPNPCPGTSTARDGRRCASANSPLSDAFVIGLPPRPAMTV